MKIDPEMEAYFVGISLLHGTNPYPLFGVERNKLAQELTKLFAEHPCQPAVFDKLRRNYAELGGRLLDVDPMWFYSRLADMYLNWLYASEQSKNLLADSLQQMYGHMQKDGLASFRRAAVSGQGIAQKKINWWKA